MKYLYLSLLIFLLPASAFCQLVTGTVYNAHQKPLPGITVTEKGTHAATTTDDHGQFSIKASSTTPVLLFTATNMEPLEIAVTNQKELKVILNPRLTPLDEVHVIAYGTSTQRNSVGSISKITSAEIGQQPVTNPLAALQGRVPGLNITSSGGVPGSSFIVQVRGQNSLNPAGTGLAPKDQPLFIIDGVPFAPQNANINQFQSVSSPGQGSYYGNPYGGVSPFNSINPSDIESIEVLRDADATAIYGSRGANGVILITTKKGKAGTTNLNVAVDNGLSMAGRSMPMMNTQQYLRMRKEAFANDGLVPDDILYDAAYAPDITVFDQGHDTDWKQYFLGNTARHLNTNAAISGGSANTQFRIAGGFNRDTYILPGDYGENRLSLSSNIHHASNDKRLTVDFTAAYAYRRNNSSQSQSLLTAFSLEPNYPEAIDSYGKLLWDYQGVPLDGSYAAYNPFSSLKTEYSIRATSLNSNLQLSYEVAKGLYFRVSSGYSSFGTDEYTSTPLASQNPAYNPTASARFGLTGIKTGIAEPQVEYKSTYKKGIYSVMVGGTYQNQDTYSTQVEGTGYINDGLIHSISGSPLQTASDASLSYKYTALFARLNFRWDSRYILSLNGRRDGSSRFGPGKQFGNFGSAGAGWLFSEEAFIKNTLPVLSYGKLRASYGITGSDGIGDYNFISRYAPTSYNYGGTLGFLPQNLSNDQFSWGTTKKLEFGLELGFWQDRVLFTSSWYRDRSGNQLIRYQLPAQTGFNNVVENSPALVQNTGLEFTAQAKLISGKDLRWDMSFNATIPRNKLLAFPGLASSAYATYYIIGKSVNELKGFRSAGVNPATGLFQFYDASGKITNSPQRPAGGSFRDYYDLGSLDPKFYGGWGNNLSYRNFQLGIFVEFKKQTGRNYLGQLYGTPGIEVNQPAALIDSHWEKPGDQAEFQKFASQYGDAAVAYSNFIQSDAVFSDASYIRLKTVSLSYAIPDRLLKKIGASALRIYVNAQNLLTITGYKGNDPETQSFFGVPTLKTITRGLQLNY